jgi:hypothetical protein
VEVKAIEPSAGLGDASTDLFIFRFFRQAELRELLRTWLSLAV